MKIIKITSIFLIVLSISFTTKAQNIKLYWTGNDLVNNAGKTIGGFYNIDKDFISVKQIGKLVSQVVIAGKRLDGRLMFHGKLSINKENLTFYSQYYDRQISCILSKMSKYYYVYYNDLLPQGTLIYLRRDLSALIVEINGKDIDADNYKYTAIVSRFVPVSN